ncbi:MAG: hypothetical protein WDO19_03015 [Bacteroidota bacterium]
MTAVIFSSAFVLHSPTTGKQELNNTEDTIGITKGYFSKDGIPVPECHASTILHLGNGEMMAAWFGGKKEGNDNVGIWFTHGRPGNWSEPIEIAKIREMHIGTRYYFNPGRKDIFIF